jgi:hypothetical protein
MWSDGASLPLSASVRTVFESYGPDSLPFRLIQ